MSFTYGKNVDNGPMATPGIIHPALVTCARDTLAITLWDLANAGPDIVPVRTIRESVEIGDVDAIAVHGNLCAVLGFTDVRTQDEDKDYYDVMVFDLSKQAAEVSEDYNHLAGAASSMVYPRQEPLDRKSADTRGTDGPDSFVPGSR
jgi:hypothetical protein